MHSEHKKHFTLDKISENFDSDSVEVNKNFKTTKIQVTKIANSTAQARLWYQIKIEHIKQGFVFSDLATVGKYWWHCGTNYNVN